LGHSQLFSGRESGRGVAPLLTPILQLGARVGPGDFAVVSWRCIRTAGSLFVHFQ